MNININMEKILSKHEGPRDLGGLIDKYLYITVLVQEDTGAHTTHTRTFMSVVMIQVNNTTSPSGGLKQEAEYAAVKFVKSPYRLSLVSTPPFIKPNLPYNIQVKLSGKHI